MTVIATVLTCLLSLLPHAWAQAHQVYEDSLQNGWENWSWATVNLGNAAPVSAGTSSISVNADNWEALYLHRQPLDGAQFTNLVFKVHGGPAGGQSLQVQATRNGAAQDPVVLAPLPAGSWRTETLSLSALGVANATDFDGFWVQIRTASLVPTFYLDDIALIPASGPPPQTNYSVTLAVDAARNVHPVSPLIYGVAFASMSELADLNAPLNRSGGNAETRYNWLLNAHNRGGDWYFESLADSPAVPGAATDEFIADTRAAAAEPMITVPMIGWVPKLGPNRGRLASYSIAKYGPQTGNDAQWFADAGNGISVSNNTAITWNDPNDANSLTNSTFQETWLRHLTNRWGPARSGGVRYFCMDNEHTLWHATHRDVHPVGATMREIRDALVDYAGRVRSVEPEAIILAPEEWGWSGYFWSGYDQQWSSANGDWNPAHFPDRGTNEGWDYLPWLLDQARQHELATGRRLLDVLTVHFYPQGGEFGNDTSASRQERRNRSTRALWDPNYVDPTWINSVVKLIPRLKEWVAQYYPGLRIGITEYNWGAENHINGATTQADIYGIFGREGLDIATRWTTPAANTPTFKAMKMYRNYDGANSGFGDLSVAATAPDPDNLSCFAALRSADNALTIMVVNKRLQQAASVGISLTNFTATDPAQLWQLTSANVITRLPDLVPSANLLTNTLPAQSVTLFVVPGAPPNIAPELSLNRAGNALTLLLKGLPGKTYTLYSSDDLTSWLPVRTNTLTAETLAIPVSPTNRVHYFKAAALGSR